MKKIFLIYSIIVLTAFMNTANAGDIFYTVVISSGKNVQAAQKLADDMIKKGFEASVINVDLNTGNTNRVCIGKSSTKEGAEVIQKKLKTAGYSNSWIAVMNGQAETKSVDKEFLKKEVKPGTTVTVKKVEKVKEADEDEYEDSEDDISEALKPMAKTTTIVVKKSQPVTEKSGPVAEKKVAKSTKKENTAIPSPPDVDKLPLALPKEFSGNKPEGKTIQTKTEAKTPSIKTNEGSISEDEVFSTDTILIITGKKSDVTNSAKNNSNDNIIYPGVTTIETDTLNRNVIIVTSDVILTTEDDVITPSSNRGLTSQQDEHIISNDKLLITDESSTIKTNSTDTFEIFKSTQSREVIHTKSQNTTEGNIVEHTITVGTAEPMNRSTTTDFLTVESSSAEKTEISIKPVETDKKPKMENLIPGTNLSYNQFYIEIKKVFYALEKYSLASGTLLNEYIDPIYGTYIRYRNNNIVGYEKMVKPKDIYKNPQVKSNVLMFFQDMVKVRRQPPIIEQLPQYDCALKHVPGLNLYLSSLAKDNKFYEETVKCLNSDDTALTDTETANILEANKSINAAFAIGSSELVKAVYFAIEGEKVYLRYIDMYDNCEKK